MGEGGVVLSFEVCDISGRVTQFRHPLRMSMVSSQDAPADSLTAVFGITGRVPVLSSIRVNLDGELLFFGYVDEQSESLTKNGRLLQIRARSPEAVLLDNEARPQQYFMPSMPLFMERHFEPLGFTGFIGSSQPFNGELSISKGESEWQVLCSFCEKFLRVTPKIRENGIIDVSGNDSGKTVIIGSSHDILSVKYTLKRSRIISDIYARTYAKGGYEMHMESTAAKSLGVKRTRYVNTLASKTRSPSDTEKIIPHSEAAAYRCELTVSGSVPCSVGDEIILEGKAQHMKVIEVHHTFSESGERTRIFTEVTEHVDWQEYGKRQ